MESLRELKDLLISWSFLPLALAIAVLLTAGTGAWKPRFGKILWIATAGLLATAFVLGLRRHEWGEVMFNGQLL